MTLSSRGLGVVSLAVLAAAALTTDGAVYSLGNQPTSSGVLAQGSVLLLGLLLGWAIPGLSLVSLRVSRPLEETDLPRALLLGVGYLVAVSLVHALIVGHAPARPVLLILLGVPPCVLIIRSVSGPSQGLSRGGLRAAAWTLGAAVVLTAILWPKIRYGGMNGDGAEAFELSASLATHPLPRFELEGATVPRFGTPVIVPNLTGAFLAQAEMQILGRSEVATRLIFVPALVLLVAMVGVWARARDASSWGVILAVAAVSVLWCTYYVSYKPPYDLAEPPGINMLTSALWLAGAWELLRGSVRVSALGIVLATLTTYAAPVLSVGALAALWWRDPQRGARAVRWIGLSGALVVAVALAVGLATGDAEVWVRQLYREYWLDLVDQGRRVDSAPLFGKFLLMTGLLPVLVWLRARRLSRSGVVLMVAATGYLLVTLAGSHKMLHYLVPLPWLFLVPALEASTARLRWGAVAVLGLTFVLSWPTDPDVRVSTAMLGREACVQGYDYETAALQAQALYGVLERPLASDRFAVGRHTFVRYALELKALVCVIGLSPETPPDALALNDGTPAIWTRDVNRLAYWRFRPVRWAESLLFRLPPRASYSTDASAWQGRLALGAEPGRSLMLSGTATPTGPDAVATPGLALNARARLLVPVGASQTGATLGLWMPEARAVQLQINGGVVAEVDVPGGESLLVLPVGLRTGWNLLRLDGADGALLRWLEGTSDDE